MHIFIDETGTFTATNRQGAFSLVCAYVIPERNLRQATNILRRFKTENGFRHDVEVKRKNVSEPAYFKLLGDLKEIDAVAFAVASDASWNPFAADHQQEQIRLIRLMEPKMIHEVGKEAVRKMASSVESLSTQNWVELLCRVRLIWNVIRHATNYFVYRTPSTLGSFKWVFDAKDRNSPFDSTLTDITLRLLQEDAARYPAFQYKGADYSHFERFYSTKEYPEWLPQPDHKHGTPGNIIDAPMIWRSNLHFQKSNEIAGLQLVDLVASGLRGVFRKAFVNNTEAETRLGALMPRPTRRFKEEVIELVSVTQQSGVAAPDAATIALIRRMQDHGRPFIVRAPYRRDMRKGQPGL